MPPSPPSQSLRQAAAYLAFEPDGSFLFACGPGAYRNNGWDGFGRFDAATRKATIVQAPIEGPIALAGDCVLGVKDRGPTLVDRSGAVRAQLEPLEDDLGDLEGATASDDGRWAALLCGRGLVLLDLAAGTRRGAPLRADACAFSAEELLYVTTDDDETSYLVRRPLAAKQKEVRTRLPAWSHLSGVLQRRDGSLLSSRGVLLDEKTGAERDLGEAHCAAGWGLTPGTLVRARRDGTVELIDLQGKVRRSFARPRRGQLLTGGTAGGWFTCTTGDFIERYQLGQSAALPKERAPRKAAAPRKPIASRAHQDPRAAGLLAAYWKDPDDDAPLRAWADLLSEHGDPRGEFIQLSHLERPNAAQRARLDALRRLGGHLVGPARDFLRRWTFDGSTGLVERASCEAQGLVDGFEHIAALNPRLELLVTSLRKRTKATVAALARLPLGRIRTLSLAANALSDASFAALAPALAGVKDLGLERNGLTPAGLAPLAHLEGVEHLRLGSTLLEAPGVAAEVRRLLPGLQTLDDQPAGR